MKKLNLKIIIPIVVVIIATIGIVIFINNKSINITLENYNNYFKIYVSYLANPNSTPLNHLTDATARVQAVSNNFHYENIEFDIRATGNATVKENGEEKVKNFIETITIKCDASGNGYGTKNDVYIEAIYDYLINKPDINLEVLAVRGKIKPIK